MCTAVQRRCDAGSYYRLLDWKRSRPSCAFCYCSLRETASARPRLPGQLAPSCQVIKRESVWTCESNSFQSFLKKNKKTIPLLPLPAWRGLTSWVCKCNLLNNEPYSWWERKNVGWKMKTEKYWPPVCLSASWKSIWQDHDTVMPRERSGFTF